MPRRAPAPALQVEQLEDRLTPAGSVIPAGEFNWTQYSPTGELGQLVWNGGTLVYRARVANTWQETAVASSGTFTAGQYNNTDQVQTASQTAQLVFTSDGTPHVLFLEKQWSGAQGKYQTYIQHYGRTSAGWQKLETIVPNWVSQWGPNNLVAEAGPNNTIHIIFTESNAAATGVGNFGTGHLIYANNAAGWTFAKIADTADLSQDVWFTGGRWAPRFLSLAVDAQNKAHVTYTPNFFIAGAFSTVRSTLMYATNRSGAWASQVVMAPQDGTADAGLGASVAIAPNGTVAVASYYVDRFNTGSPQSSKLMYHTLVNGSWTHANVATVPNGYVGADGARFTGFAPQLYFDSAGRANIVFSDEAGQHLPVSFANQFAGQIRLATQNGSSWAIQTVFRQTDPLRNQVFYPVAAARNGQTTLSGLVATSTVDGNGNPVRTDFGIIDINAPFGLATAPVSNTPPAPPAPVNKPPGTAEPVPGGVATSLPGWAVALDGGVYSSQVYMFRANGSLAMTVMPYGPNYRGGVRFARADMNGDGIADLITVPKAGIEARVRFWNGATAELMVDFAPVPGYIGGLNIAAGDVNHDGAPDIVLGLDQTTIPAVLVYSGRGLTRMGVFLAYPHGLPGGVRVATGDINRDGFADIVTTPGIGVPLVSTYDGRAVAMGLAGQRMFGDFYLYPPQFQFGINLAVGDVDGDGYGDIIGGTNIGPSYMKVVSGQELLSGRQTPLVETFLWMGNSGARVAATDANGDGLTDITVTAAGPFGGYVGLSLAPAQSNATINHWLNPLPGVATGVFVG